MTQAPGEQPPVKDDLEAVRSIADTLKAFTGPERERIIRWARERLGMPPAAQTQSTAPTRSPAADTSGAPVRPPEQAADQQPQAAPAPDIRTFVAAKRPQGENKFAATVAYYHQFVASAPERRDYITADDLQDACRKVDRNRMKYPKQVLINAFNAGLFDRPEKGKYKLNTVGENLVAMVLPEQRGGVAREEVTRVGSKRALAKATPRVRAAARPKKGR